MKYSTTKILLLFISLTLIWGFPILSSINKWGINDWDLYLFLQGVSSDTILRFHQWPFWNPYQWGGNVLFAHPVSHFLTPTFLLELIFGEVIGTKLACLVYLFIGLVGMYCLSKRLGFSSQASYLCAILFLLAGFYSLKIAEGHYDFKNIVYLPWIVFFYFRALKNSENGIQYIIYSALLISLIIFEVGIYIAPFTVMQIFFMTILERRKTKNYWGIFIKTILFAAFLSAIKLIPLVEFLRLFPRLIESKEYLTISSLYTIFLSRNQKLGEIHFPEQQWGWHEYGSYIGWGGVVLFFTGLLKKRDWSQEIHTFFWVTVIFFCLALGDLGKLSPWYLLHKLPLFSSHHVPSRYLVMVLFNAAFICAAGFDSLKTHWSNYRLEIMKVILLVFMTVDFISVDWLSLKQAFTIAPLPLKREERFITVRSIPSYGAYSSSYPAFLQNKGVLNGYFSVQIPTAAKAIEDVDYQGEAYLVGSKGNVNVSSWSPNRVTLGINAEEPDRVVLNQNYDPNHNWWVNGKGKAECYNGLVSTTIKAGKSVVEFEYFPLSFLVGLSITLFSLVLAILGTFSKYRFVLDVKTGIRSFIKCVRKC